MGKAKEEQLVLIDNALCLEFDDDIYERLRLRIPGKSTDILAMLLPT
jgi:hypothetical protein